MGLLHWLQRHRHRVEFIELAVIGEHVVGQTAANDIQRLGELLHAASKVDTEKLDLDRRDPAADAKQKAPAAHLVEHADLVDQSERVIERQQVHHRAEPQLPRPLCDRGQEDAGRRRIAEWGVVVLGQMIAVEPGPVVSLDQLQPLLEELAYRHAAIIQMVKDPEEHFPTSRGWNAAAARVTLSRTLLYHTALPDRQHSKTIRGNRKSAPLYPFLAKSAASLVDRSAPGRDRMRHE